MLLKDYDSQKIASSPIQYYKSVQKLTRDLLLKLDDFDRTKADTIRAFNEMKPKKYEDNPKFSESENDFLRERQEFFSRNFSLVMNDAKSRIFSVKKQAEELESRLHTIGNA